MIPRYMMSEEDYERKEKGLPPLPKERVETPEAEAPVVKRELKLADIEIEKVTALSAKVKEVKNKDGVIFTGFDVILTLKKPSGRPSEKKEVPTSISGWMIEGEFIELRNHLRGRIDLRNINY